MAASVRVGNSLGAGNAQAVKKTIKVALGLIGKYILKLGTGAKTKLLK